jgi:hypothetical protein
VTAAPAGGDDPTRGWSVGDRVLFHHRFGFDARLQRGTIVGIRTDVDPDGKPVAAFTVEVDPADGAGRLQLGLVHLYRPDAT